jgi:hypothetical protein
MIHMDTNRTTTAKLACRTKTQTPAPDYKIVRKRRTSIRPSPENLSLYNAINRDDPEIVQLAESIKKHGLQEPLKVTQEGYIVSGHRRFVALEVIGQLVIPCHVLPIRRNEMTKDDFVALLREHNRQRRKTVAEEMREELIDIDPAEAYEALSLRRRKAIYAPELNGAITLRFEGKKRRHTISADKAQHVWFIKKVVFEDRRDYWPLSVRGAHYALLNYRFLRNNSRGLPYANDSNSYQATSDLITRLRLIGEVPWEAFDDGTRPVQEFRPFADVREFIRQERANLFAGYWRDLLQTQPNHVEVLCEKNTVFHMALSVTRQFQIPTSSGRGFNSIDPWHDLLIRYQASGKMRLIVIVLSDYDPEGEMIPHVGGRTLRDDLSVARLSIIKAGVTREQISTHNLPKQNFAKEASSNYAWFVDRNDGDDSVYELEALEPSVMLANLEGVITSVLDLELFNREVAKEREESVYLEAARRKAATALEGLD